MDISEDCRLPCDAHAVLPFAPAEYDARLLGLRAIMDGRGVDAVVLTSAGNVAWYSGVPPCSPRRPCALVVTARDSVRVCAVPDMGRPLRRGHGGSFICPDGGGAGLGAAVAQVAGRGRAVGYEGGHLTGRRKARLVAALAPRETRDIAADIARQRMRKSPAEIGLLRQVAAVADTGGFAIREAARVGLREADIARAGRDAMELEIARRFPDAGCRGIRVRFRSGPNTDDPHSPAAVRAVGSGDILTLAAVPTISGYCAALGRTLFARTVDAASLAVWQGAIAAREYGISLLKPGATCAGVARAIGGFLAERDLLRYRILGFPTHCRGRAAGPDPCGNTALEPGMVIGMDLMLRVPQGRPGAGGYHERDILLIGADGAEAMAKHPCGPGFNVVG